MRRVYKIAYGSPFTPTILHSLTGRSIYSGPIESDSELRSVGTLMRMKKSYSSAFKAQVVLELLKEDKTLAQLASKYEVHPTLLRDWKAIALKALPTAFDRRDSAETAQLAHEQQTQDLYAEIGRLTTQVTWLKKKLGLWHGRNG